jgi:hypothetical protein
MKSVNQTLLTLIISIGLRLRVFSNDTHGKSYDSVTSGLIVDVVTVYKCMLNFSRHKAAGHDDIFNEHLIFGGV